MSETALSEPNPSKTASQEIDRKPPQATSRSITLALLLAAALLALLSSVSAA